MIMEMCEQGATKSFAYPYVRPMCTRGSDGQATGRLKGLPGAEPPTPRRKPRLSLGAGTIARGRVARRDPDSPKCC